MTIELFVNGTLMTGLALHRNLDGAELLGSFLTVPAYRLYSIDDVHPGMYRVSSGGIAVPGELYRMSEEILARVEAGEPPHLYRGPVELEGGRIVDGILFPREQAEHRHRDISSYGGWRQYIASPEYRGPTPR